MQENKTLKSIDIIFSQKYQIFLMASLVWLLMGCTLPPEILASKLNSIEPPRLTEVCSPPRTNKVTVPNNWMASVRLIEGQGSIAPDPDDYPKLPPSQNTVDPAVWYLSAATYYMTGVEEICLFALPLELQRNPLLAGK